jgi:hypothetical protein
LSLEWGDEEHEQQHDYENTSGHGQESSASTPGKEPTHLDSIGERHTLKDDAATEKISDLPRKLSSADAPPGSDPDVGDFAYFAPWGNLALFYKDFGYSVGLVKLPPWFAARERRARRAIE